MRRAAALRTRMRYWLVLVGIVVLALFGTDILNFLQAWNGGL